MIAEPTPGDGALQDPDAELAADMEDLGDGCDFVRWHPRFAHCTDCPLPACRYDLEAGQGRALAICYAVARLARAGRDRDEIAAQLGVSKRTVVRSLRAIALARLRAGLPAILPPAAPGIVVTLAGGAPVDVATELVGDWPGLIDRSFLVELERAA